MSRLHCDRLRSIVKAWRHLARLDERLDYRATHGPIKRAKFLVLMATRAVHRVGHNCFLKRFSEALRSNRRIGRGESRTKFFFIQVRAKTRRAIASETVVGVPERLFFTCKHASSNGINWKDAAFMAFRTIVGALSQFPAPFDLNWGALTVYPEIILEIGVECSIRIEQRRHDRDIPDRDFFSRVSHTKLHPLFGNSLVGRSRARQLVIFGNSCCYQECPNVVTGN